MYNYHQHKEPYELFTFTCIKKKMKNDSLYLPTYSNLMSSYDVISEKLDGEWMLIDKQSVAKMELPVDETPDIVVHQEDLTSEEKQRMASACTERTYSPHRKQFYDEYPPIAAVCAEEVSRVISDNTLSAISYASKFVHSLW